MHQNALHVSLEDLEKARTHKYLRRRRGKGGKYE